MEGIIVKNISNDYVVVCDNVEYNCKVRGKFRNIKVSPKVGDKVIIDKDKLIITDIRKRRNSLIRPNVANIDKAIIVTAVKNPSFDSYLLDKLLTIVSFYNIEPIICFTKLDLLDDGEWNEINKYIDYYRSLGYLVVDNRDTSVFGDILDNSIVVLTGQSGAGKSSLINLLDSKLNLKTDEISYALNRGKHTTRHTELYEIMNGFVVDTPGFSSVDLFEMKEIDVRDNMIDMFDNLSNCKYRDCMHVLEDGCYVRELVENGKIIKSRYNNYLAFLNDIKKNKKVM